MTDAAKRVDIYTTPTCHFCQMTKAFFKEHGVEYTEHDVAADARARQEMLDTSGQMGVPVIVVRWKEGEEDKQEIVVGFNEPKLADVLGVAA